MMKGIMLEISRPPEVQKLPGTHVPLAHVPIKLGNSSHPSSVEVVAKYPDWTERNAALLRAIVATLSGVSQRALGFALINPLEREDRRHGQVNFYVGIPFASRWVRWRK